MQAAKALVRRPGLPSGLKKVAEAHLLHLSVEATMLRPEWAVLFTDEERAMAAHKVELAREYERSLKDST